MVYILLHHTRYCIVANSADYSPVLFHFSFSIELMWDRFCRNKLHLTVAYDISKSTNVVNVRHYKGLYKKCQRLSNTRPVVPPGNLRPVSGGGDGCKDLLKGGTMWGEYHIINC